MATLARRWRRRQPEDTVLYQVLAAHLETFLARLEDDDTRAPLPRFVVRELPPLSAWLVTAVGGW